MEAKCIPFDDGQRAPVLQRSIEQRECAGDVGLDKRRGTHDGPVHVAFRGKMDDRVGLVFRQQVAYKRAIENGAANEEVGRIAFDGRQVVEVAGVRERVEIDDFVAAAHPFEDKVGADESSSPGHKQDFSIHSFLSCALLLIVDRPVRRRDQSSLESG